MTRATTCLAVTLLLLLGVSAPAQSNSRAETPSIVARWIEACESIGSVHFDFSLVKYDTTLGTYSSAAGEAWINSCKTSDREGYWDFHPSCDAEPPLEEIEYGNKRLRPIPSPSSSLVLTGRSIFFTEDNGKTYQSYPLEIAFFGRPLFRISGLYPFVPGLPNQAELANWSFEVAEEHSDKIFVKATPRKGAKSMHMHADLMLIREPTPLLKAVRYHQVAGDSMVFLFGNVAKDPGSHQDPAPPYFLCGVSATDD